MIEIGSMDDLRFIERSSGTEYKFEDCRENGDPSKGDTGRLILGKNLTDNFGINIGYLSGRYQVCHLYYAPKTYDALRSRYDVEFEGATLGLNYSLFTQCNQVQNPSDRSFTRWFDMRLSYMPNHPISLQKDKAQGKTSYALPGAILGEFSLATWTFDMVKVSLISTHTDLGHKNDVAGFFRHCNGAVRPGRGFALIPDSFDDPGFLKFLRRYRDTALSH